MKISFYATVAAAALKAQTNALKINMRDYENLLSQLEVEAYGE